MLIYIVRHGLTEWNKLKKLQGAADVPLAKEGILLAEKTGEALKDVKFDICFTSPLSRARQTAECVLGDRNVPIIPDKRIQEINFGDLEGGCVRDAEGNYIDPQVETFFRDPVNFKRPENGEDIFDVIARTKDFWEEKTSDPSLAALPIWIKRFWLLPTDVQSVHSSRISIMIRKISGTDACLRTAVSILWK